MSVATQLGLGNFQSGLMAQAAGEWGEWCQDDPALAPVPHLVNLPGWLRNANHAPREDLLCALGRRASTDGQDELAAAATLSWVLLPGASLLAARLRNLTPDIDALVAGQLWLEVRGLHWRSTCKVAATVLLNTRRGVLADLGLPGYVETSWRRSSVLDPMALAHLPLAPAVEPDDPSAELDQLLERACEDRVIDERDRALLRRLMAGAEKFPATRCGSRGGLTSFAATSSAAVEAGVSARTVRRRTRRSVMALTAAYARSRIPA